jgi:hypothetical protein
MYRNKLALVAIALWLATIAVFSWYFVRGNTAPGTDNRTAIVLNPAERDLVLMEMRGLLVGVHGIVDGLNSNSPDQVARAARAVGMASAADVNPALMAKLPLSFKQLGMSVHHDMDELASAADSNQPASALQNMLGKTLGKCVACHASWQLKSGS